MWAEVNIPMGSLAKTGFDGGLGSPTPTSFSALTRNSYSQPFRRSITQYSTLGWILSVLQRTHLKAEEWINVGTGGGECSQCTKSNSAPQLFIGQPGTNQKGFSPQKSQVNDSSKTSSAVYWCTCWPWSPSSLRCSL